MLDQITRSVAGNLADLSGGYGRMMDADDRIVTVVNKFLEVGDKWGVLQRLGAGWGEVWEVY